jgi:alkylation response protein AidB-like acyl-CoA dehydrogenase
MINGVFSLVLIPMADLVIDRSWDVAGMRGTGSHSVVAEDVLVPAARVVSGQELHYPPDAKTLQLWGSACSHRSWPRCGTD